MTNKKIKIINAQTEHELANKINELTIPIFAVQPMQKTDSTWCAFVYYEPLKNEVPTNPPIVNDNTPATPNQIWRLIKMGYSKEESNKMSKSQAYNIIKSKVEKNG